MSFRLVWPSQHTRITQHFMQRPHVYAQFGFPGHEGIDLGTPLGTEVYAAADGIVMTVDEMVDGYGKWIKLLHHHTDGIFETIYGHLSQQLVFEGQEVHAGQIIGLAGSTGFSTGPHLHLTLKLHGATAAGYTTYTVPDQNSSREGTYPKDIIDPSPWLFEPPVGYPARPRHTQHPSFLLSDPTVSAQSSDTMNVVVDIGTLNVRQAPSTTSAVVAELAKGDQLTINTQGFGSDQLPWHRITAPAHLVGKWVAKKFGATVYLVPSGAVDDLTETTVTVEVDAPDNLRQPTPSTPPPISDMMVQPQEDSELVQVVNTGAIMLKVREAPTTTAEIADRLPDGTFLWITLESQPAGVITWRQIASPPEHKGRWVAQHFRDTPYLVSVPMA